MSSIEQAGSDAVHDWIHDTERENPVADPPAGSPSETRTKLKANRQLFTAINSGDDSGVEDALRNGAEPNDARPESWFGRPPLHEAVARARGHIDIVLILLEKGANPNILAGEERETPLHRAAEEGQTEVVELLVQYKADLNATDKNQETPLDRALKARGAGFRYRENCHPAASILAAQPGLRLDLHSKATLHRASQLGWADVVQHLLTRGASVSARDERGKYPMHYACEEGNLDIVLQLIKGRASPDVHDEKGETPLHVAVAKDRLDVIRMLIIVKALVNARDTRGRTAIFKAAKNGNVEAIGALAEAGALIEVHDATGKTPLHIASAHNHGYAIRKLIELGADIDHAAHDGSRPIHEAMLYEATTAIDQLLQSGADMALGSTGHTGPIRIIEPPWDRLLRNPFFGQKVGLEGLTMSPPATNSGEYAVCNGLRCALWPWEPAPYVLATPTVHELLYSKVYHLQKKVGTSNTTWIHLPANNVSSLHRPSSPCECSSS